MELIQRALAVWTCTHWALWWWLSVLQCQLLWCKP